MKRIFVFIFLGFIIHGFTFCQTQEELDLEMEEDLKKGKPVEEEKIFKVVKHMHRFPGCEGQGKSKKELEECSEHKMQEFISSHLKYPAKARENMTQGIVIIELTIKREEIEKIKLLYDIGDGCGQEAIRVINLMRKPNIRWVQGCSRCRPFTTKFTIPISFKLSKK